MNRGRSFSTILTFRRVNEAERMTYNRHVLWAGNLHQPPPPHISTPTIRPREPALAVGARMLAGVRRRFYRCPLFSIYDKCSKTVIKSWSFRSAGVSMWQNFSDLYTYMYLYVFSFQLFFCLSFFHQFLFCIKSPVVRLVNMLRFGTNHLFTNLFVDFMLLLFISVIYRLKKLYRYDLQTFWSLSNACRPNIMFRGTLTLFLYFKLS